MSVTNKSKRYTKSFEAAKYMGNVLSKVHLYARLSQQIASKWNFDVIHAHDWVTCQAGINIKYETGKPFILHIHSLETDRSVHSVRNGIYQPERAAME